MTHITHFRRRDGRFIPLTVEDYANRSGISTDDAATALATLLRQGLVVSSGAPCGNIRIYDITEAGRMAIGVPRQPRQERQAPQDIAALAEKVRTLTEAGLRLEAIARRLGVGVSVVLRARAAYGVRP